MTTRWRQDSGRSCTDSVICGDSDILMCTAHAFLFEEAVPGRTPVKTRSRRNTKKVLSTAFSGHLIIAMSLEACDTTSGSPCARALGKTIRAPIARSARYVIRRKPRPNRSPSRPRSLFTASNLQHNRSIARLSKRARPVLGSIPSLDVYQSA